MSHTPVTQQHTPGPWSWQKLRGEPDGRFYIDSPTLMIGNVEPCAAMTVEESIANARLIAAAPELLAALQEAIAVMLDCAERDGDVPVWNLGGEGHGAITRANAAIRKATGG